ncbi:MAG: RNA-binding S4 domain-containing protein [Rubrimonas sp.]|uniref:RNA-binding S4 domain-containing protein n=1 Tax=Rubrimonas sp. TaxID=2036015 RepID=UPI002FDE0336
MSDADGPPRARLDVWLWRARFFRTRSLAAEAAAKGLRVNGQRVAKPGAGLKTGDVLTFAQAGRIRVIEVAALGDRRGPAAEAQALYVDRDPPADAAPDAGEGPP